MKRLLLFGLCLALIVPVSGFLPNQGKDDEKKDKNTKGWIGVSIQDVTEKIAKREKLKSEEGAYINEIMDDSPAKSAGLQESDVVVEFNGRSIYDADDLAKSVQKMAPGTKTSIVVIRNGEKKTVQVTVGKAPRGESFAFAFPRSRAPIMRMFRSHHSLGLALMNLNKQLGEYFGAPEDEGVLVEQVESKSEGEKAGFKAGDVILRIGKRSIYDVEDVQRALDAYRDEGKVDVEVLRKGSRKSLSVDIASEDSDSDDAFWYEFSPRHGTIRNFRVPTPGLNFNLPDPGRIRIQMDGLRKLEETLKSRMTPWISKSLKNI